MKGGVIFLFNKLYHDPKELNHGCFLIFLSEGLFRKSLFNNCYRRSLQSLERYDI